MNLFLLLQLWVKYQDKLGSLAIVGNQLRRRITLNSKLYVVLAPNHELPFSKVYYLKALLAKVTVKTLATGIWI